MLVSPILAPILACSASYRVDRCTVHRLLLAIGRIVRVYRWSRLSSRVRYGAPEYMSGAQK